MLHVSRLLIATVLALVLCGATTAVAATGNALYRTDDQAALYLAQGLRDWSGIDLRELKSKAAFCVSAAEQSGKPGLGRVNAFGIPVFRSFSCVLTVRVRNGKNGTRVFPIDLLKERRGWRATSDRG